MLQREIPEAVNLEVAKVRVPNNMILHYALSSLKAENACAVLQQHMQAANHYGVKTTQHKQAGFGSACYGSSSGSGSVLVTSPAPISLSSCKLVMLLLFLILHSWQVT